MQSGIFRIDIKTKEVKEYNLIYCIDEAEEHLSYIKSAQNE